MSEAPLMNDEAARSPTGEILEPSQIAPNPETTKPDGEGSIKAEAEAAVAGAEGKAEGDKAPEGEKPAAGAPETYADFTAPEGYTLDKGLLEKATPIFKELGLTQEAAQRLVTLQAEQQIAAAKAPQDAYENMRKDWRAQVNADPDITKATSGGKTGVDAVKLDIGRALGHLPPTEATAFREAMDLTGAGDHPAFVKALWRLAQLVGEGHHVAGANPSPKGQEAPGTKDRPAPAKALYPNLG